MPRHRVHHPSAAVSREVLVVDGLRVKITRKPIRGMYLRVDAPSGEVRVSAPLGMPDEAVERFVHTRASWIDLRRRHVREVFGGSEESGRHRWTPELRGRARGSLETRLPGLLGTWVPIIGRTPTDITFREMTTRWGSCTPATGRIRLNLQLGLMEDRLVRYVLVHELTHLLERGHGPSFQRLMDGWIPEWRELRHDINRHAPLVS
ncbi:M48 family metallopeptidase [uncultured Bifidobacterium sp.]|uniref:M48 family metallopeptidase n=1 Tax=uncultured Bifidobacterium sp. TaxID=165187 RepID=UPI0037DC4C57